MLLHPKGDSLSYRTFDAWMDPETKSPGVNEIKHGRQIELYRGSANG